MLLLSTLFALERASLGKKVDVIIEYSCTSLRDLPSERRLTILSRTRHEITSQSNPRKKDHVTGMNLVHRYKAIDYDRIQTYGPRPNLLQISTFAKLECIYVYAVMRSKDDDIYGYGFLQLGDLEDGWQGGGMLRASPSGTSPDRDGRLPRLYAS
jgi:hypothetical protein